MTCVPTSWTKMTRGGMRWWIAPRYQDLFLGPAGLRLEEWLRNGQAHLVKEGAHRRVYRVALSGLTFYLKHNRVPDWKTWLRQLIRPSKARMEFDRVQAVASRGVCTVEPLALGEHQAFLTSGESMLITRSLDGTQQLNAFLATTLNTMETGRQTRLRQHLARGLGLLVARLHAAGILHQDLHPANILIRLDDDDRPVLFLIDLNGVQVGGPLGWRASRANLIVLNRWFVLRSSRADRLRFWRAYCEARGLELRGSAERGARRVKPSNKARAPRSSLRAPPSTPPRPGLDLAQELEHATWASNLGFWKYRDRRYLRNNRYFRRLHGAGVVGHAVADLDAQAVTDLVADPDEPFRRPGVRLLKDAPSSTVIEMDMLVDGRPRAVIYKRFRVTSWSAPWGSLLHQSKALRSWMYGQGFRDRCLPTARPLAVLHRCRRGLFFEGYFLAEKIENAQELHHFLADLDRLPPSERQGVLRRRLDEVARLIRELHRRHLSQRDLKAANILVSCNHQPPATPYQPVEAPACTLIPNSLPIPTTSVWLIDLVGVQRFRRLPRDRRVQNLARLNASFCENPELTRSDRLRFLRVYLQWGLRGRENWKAWWRDVAQATQRKVLRNLRIGRPLK